MDLGTIQKKKGTHTNETADMLAKEGREKKGDLWNIWSLSLFCYNVYLLDCMDIGTLVY